jgi:hypothetical protein
MQLKLMYAILPTRDVRNIMPILLENNDKFVLPLAGSVKPT